MARGTQGWRLRRAKGNGTWSVRFSHQKKQIELGTGERDSRKAHAVAAQIVADYLAGRGSHAVAAPLPAATPAAKLFSEWLSGTVLSDS